MRLAIALFALGVATAPGAQTPAQVPDSSGRLATLPGAQCDSTRSDRLADSTIISLDSADVPPGMRITPFIIVPDSLHHRYARTVLELVIDRTGRVDPCRIRVLEETTPAFTAAVLLALKKTRYSPAQRHGQVVAIRVKQPFENLPVRRR
jgi:TonB family protein